MTETIEPPMAPPTSALAVELHQRLAQETRAAAELLVAPPAPFVLASASPRRRQLLQSLRLPFEVAPADIEEIPAAGETPKQFAARTAAEKAVFVAARHPRRRVLAADTVVALDQVIFGKPRDRNDAVRMLRALSGVTHRVFTAVVLLGEDAREEACLVETQVGFRALAPGEIESYVDGGEPFDKAGAYGIQGAAVRFVTAVVGSFSNVIGLPLEEVAAMLSAASRS